MATRRRFTDEYKRQAEEFVGGFGPSARRGRPWRIGRLPRVFRTPCCWVLTRCVGFRRTHRGPLAGSGAQAWNTTSGWWVEQFDVLRNGVHRVRARRILFTIDQLDSWSRRSSTPTKYCRNKCQSVRLIGVCRTFFRVFASSCRRIIRPTARTGTPHPWGRAMFRAAIRLASWTRRGSGHCQPSPTR